VNDLQPITIAEGGFVPLLTGNDAAIQFNRDPVSFHAQLFEQSGERKRDHEIARFSIDVQFHLSRIVAAGDVRRQVAGLGFNFSQLELARGSATGIAGLHQNRGIGK